MDKDLNHITSPQMALEELREEIKEGRDQIGKMQWSNLKSTTSKIKKLIIYLDNWRKALPESHLPYDPTKTDDLRKIIDVFIMQQIEYPYPTENLFHFKLAIGGDDQRVISLGKSWDLLEYAFKMQSEYVKEEMLEQEGVADEFGDMSDDEELPKDFEV